MTDAEKVLAGLKMMSTSARLNYWPKDNFRGTKKSHWVCGFGSEEEFTATEAWPAVKKMLIHLWGVNPELISHIIDGQVVIDEHSHL